MPSLSRNQRIAAAIAEHEPGKLYTRNKGMLSMSKAQLHDFASTREKRLPHKIGDRRKRSEFQKMTKQ